ncbi:MAG: hypothetical protein EOP10_02485 [Proteobacteria bacterium]|nr:MAG: hypothetical protein EOP10_02485 [Pseudomonadota bacterium]
MKNILFATTVIVSSVFAISCGSKSSSDDDTQAASSGTTTFAEMRVLLNANCATSGCHNGAQAPNYATITEAQMRADTRAASRVADGSMPQSGPLSAADKLKFKNFY